MNIVSKEQVESLVGGAKNVAEVATGLASELSAEAINLFMIESVLSVLKYASVFIIFYLVKRYIDFIQDAGFNVKFAKAFKLTAMIISITFFTTQSFPHLTEFSKALVAPKIFLLEKGGDYILKLKQAGK